MVEEDAVLRPDTGSNTRRSMAFRARSNSHVQVGKMLENARGRTHERQDVGGGR